MEKTKKTARLFCGLLEPDAKSGYERRIQMPEKWKQICKKWGQTYVRAEFGGH